MTEKIRKQPERTCLGCGEVRPKRELLRIVRTPEGMIKADPTGRENGRGAYICRKTECFDAAVKRHGFERAFKMTFSPGQEEEIRREVFGENAQ